MEYTSFERKRINDIYNAIKSRSREISGYVLWLNRQKAFLIVPTLSSPQPKVFCEIPDWMEMEIPPNNAYVRIKGNWKYRPKVGDGGNLTATLIFNVEYYQKSKPDIDSFKPDITFHDFREILFESLKNVDDHLQDLIAQSFVSSPKTINRLGGLTLSFYNESKGTSRLMLRNLRRYLPKELTYQHGYQLSVEELGHSIRVDPLPWLYKQYNADATLTNDTLNLLRRPFDMPIEEITISLRSENASPKTLRDPPATMSDVPIVVSKDIERSRGFFDPSSEVFKFIIATHMVPVSVTEQMYHSTLDYMRERISLITNSHPIFKSELGKGGILDMNVHGKPLSLLHIALSNGRSNVQQEINKDTIKKAMSLFEMNIIDTLDKWNLAFPGQGKYDFSWASIEQQLIVGYIIKNGPSAFEGVFNALKGEVSHDTFIRMWRELYEKGAIYEKDTGVIDVAPFLRE